MKFQFRFLLVSLLGFSLLLPAFAQNNQPVNLEIATNQPTQNIESIIVYVDTFPPYINEQNLPLGTSAATLKVLGEYVGLDIEYRYIPFADATKLMLEGKEVASFPYFHTDKRAEHFHLSKPIVTLYIQVYFNRRFGDLSAISELSNMKIGTVEDYSYGENLDAILENSTKFDTDIAALTALLNNDIKVLPMAAGVMDSLLNRHFSAQRELIKPINAIKDAEEFRVMAPKTDYGLAVVTKINQAIKLKFGSLPPQVTRVEKAPEADVAELIPAEGFPAILGYVLGDNDKNYTLPIGTKVIVLDWSEAIRNPNSGSGINRNMLLTSKVVVLNGPHVGKELMIRNMHIKLN